MKHIFIVNPAAGKRDATDFVRQSVENCGASIDYEIYRTTGPKDATKYIKSVLQDTENEYRFYSCGGDGTLNEVASGVVGHNNASITVFPCGSGNDFIKYYGTMEDFSNLSELLTAPVDKIDIMKIGESYAVNAVHFGFDTFVLETMMKVRRKFLIGGNNAYTTGVVTALIKGMKSICKLTVDGEEIEGNDLLLCTICNGKYVGGAYKCAPKSVNNDGLMEICHVKPVSRLKFLTLMGAYKEGSHLDDPRFDKYINYRRGKKVELDCVDGFHLSFDGELNSAGKCTVEIIEKALNFAVPSKLLNKDNAKEEETVVS